MLPGGSPVERSASGSRSPSSPPPHSPTTSLASRGASRSSSAPSSAPPTPCSPQPSSAARRSPYRLRNLLNIESGLNDGLALPIVVVLLAAAGSGGTATTTLLAEVIGGIAIGVAVPAAAIWLERLRFFAASAAYQPLNAVAVGLIVLAVATLTHANVFLAAFSAGITIGSLSPPMRAAFQEFGELVAELLKLAALLVFGSLISLSFLGDIGLRGYVFAALGLFAARPMALGIALLRSKLDRRERLAAAWFGPKGFASVVYGLLILEAGLPHSDELFHLVALVVTASILAHSSTDVVIARWFEPGTGPGDTAPTPGSTC